MLILPQNATVTPLDVMVCAGELLARACPLLPTTCSQEVCLLFFGPWDWCSDFIFPELGA